MRYKELIESKACGDCFQIAGRNLIDEKVPGIKLVHALVHGGGALEGRRFPHAWNEFDDIVLDNSNGNQVIMRKEHYYDKGRINPEESGAYAKYDKDAALKLMLKTKHWGPWGLDETLEE